jgi:hypothetical protein
MTEHFPMLLAQQVPASGRPEVPAPFDGKVLGSVDLGGATAVEAALDVAYHFRDRELAVSGRAHHGAAQSSAPDGSVRSS